MVKHDAGHGDHLQNLVIGKAGGLGVDQRTGAGGRIVVAAHIVLKAPTDQHLALEQRVDDREGHAFAAGGKAHVFLIALGVGDGDVEYDGLFRVGGDDQRRAQGKAVGGHRFGLRARVDERLKLGIADRSLAGRPALAARKRPAGARHAVRQRIGKGNIRVAGGERHRADGLAAVGEQQLQVRLVGLGRAVGGVVGAHFQALVAALGHRQAGGHSAEALHQLFIGKRGAGLKLDAIQIRAAVDASPIDGIPLPLRQLRDGLGTLALIQAHAGKFFQRPILIAGMLIEGENDAVFAVALDIHVNAVGIGAGFLAKRMRFVVSQRRLAHGQFARKLAVRAGQHPGRAFGQHVGQGVRRFRIFGRERQRRGVDALLLVLSLGMIEIDMIDRQLVFDLIGRAQVDDDGAEIVGRLAHVGACQIVKGHLAFLGGREGKGIAIAAETLPTGMRVSLVRGQRRQGDVRTAFHQRRFHQKRAGVAVVHVQMDDAQRRALVHAAHVQRRVGGGKQIDFAHRQIRNFRRLLRRLDGRFNGRLHRRFDGRFDGRFNRRFAGRLVRGFPRRFAGGFTGRLAGKFTGGFAGGLASGFAGRNIAIPFCRRGGR